MLAHPLKKALQQTHALSLWQPSAPWTKPLKKGSSIRITLLVARVA